MLRDMSTGIDMWSTVMRINFGEDDPSFLCNYNPKKLIRSDVMSDK